MACENVYKHLYEGLIEFLIRPVQRVARSLRDPERALEDIYPPHDHFSFLSWWQLSTCALYGISNNGDVSVV